MPQIVCKYLLGGMGNTYQVFSMRTEILLTLSILSLLCLTGLGDVGTIEYWLTKGAEEYVNGSLKEAFRSFDNATTIDPENATVWFARGMALSGLKRYEEALQSFEESIDIYPNSTQSWYGKALALRSLGRTQEAEEAWTIYRDLSYAHISFSDNRGESMEDAIVIMNARTDLEGVGSEYYYLEKRFGTDAVDRDRISQYLVEGEEGRSYDVLEVHLTSGENATIYFDITDFYGKGFI